MSKILEKITEIVTKRRAKYGSPRQNMQDIADLWTVVFRDRFGHAEDTVTPEDVAQCMRLVKEARLLTTPDHEDSLLDIVGYALVTEACLEDTK